MTENEKSMKRTTLENNVIHWANEKSLTNPVKQTLKTLSEAGELADAVCKASEEDLKNPYSKKMHDVIDAVGDIEVCLTILKKQLGLSQEGCLETAWNVIKNRKGETKNGTFVKE